jgi:signal transduction histidine kinase
MRAGASRPTGIFPLHAQILLGALAVAAVAAVVSDQLVVRLVAGIAAALAFGFLLGRRIVRPLRRLALATDRLADGCAEAPLADDSPDELGRLAFAFNHLCSNLRKTMKEKDLAALELRDANARYLELLGFASHELMQPLGVVKGYLTMMRDAPGGVLPAESRKKAVESMLRNVDALTGMATTYLALARVEGGGIELSRQRVRMLREVLVPVLEDLRVRAAARGMTIEVEREAAFDAVEVEGDANLLRTVWRNLLSNAVKYGRERTVIHVGWSEEIDAHQFHVHNEGRGIAADRVKDLFARFVRLAGDQEGKPRGLGLGLFLSREIVERHGGTIGVESREGEFSDFWFRLPR